MKLIAGSSCVVQTSEDKMLRIWDFATAKPVQTFAVQQYIHVRLAG